jgi:hypothetical protein
MGRLPWPGIGFALVAAMFLLMGVKIAAPSTPDSRFTAAEQVAVQPWRLSTASTELRAAVVAAAAAIGCFAAAGAQKRS